MATKIVSSVKFVDRFIDLGSRILDCQKYLDVKIIFNSFLEALLACACSCYPAIDTFDDDEDDYTLTEQNKTALNIEDHIVSFDSKREASIQNTEEVVLKYIPSIPYGQKRLSTIAVRRLISGVIKELKLEINSDRTFKMESMGEVTVLVAAV
ncbi:hypothetical protein ACI65C_008576 [Semiaphis heraclei]